MRRADPASRSDSYSNKKLILNVPASKRTDVGQKFDTNIDESLDSDVEDRSSTESSDMDIDEEYDGQEPMDVDEEAEDDGCEPMDVGDGCEPMDIDSDEMDIDSRADPDEDVDMLDISNWSIAFNTITTTATINTTNTISTLFQSASVLPPSTAPRATPAPAPWRPRPFSMPELLGPRFTGPRRRPNSTRPPPHTLGSLCPSSEPTPARSCFDDRCQGLSIDVRLSSKISFVCMCSCIFGHVGRAMREAEREGEKKDKSRLKEHTLSHADDQQRIKKKPCVMHV